MPFAQTRFLGCTIRSFQSQVGWNIGSPSQCVVNLARDPVAGDEFFAPGPGTPVYFEYEGFFFAGLLQRFEQKIGIDGAPIYEVTIVDPREILDGVQLITGAYSGPTGGVPNLFNVFGWWENYQGFGSSLSNEAGMPWLLMGEALLSMTGGDTYGGPINYRGFVYNLDLSQLPTPPLPYRMPSPSIGLLEAISIICEDGACDFTVSLNGQTIVVNTISRLNQPPLGALLGLAEAGYGVNLARSSVGQEARNELTSSFLAGGAVCELYQGNNIASFWGYDADGNPILGQPGQLQFTNTQGQVIDSVNAEFMTLDASSVAGIIGSTTYPATDIELRFAKHSYEAWSAYVGSQNQQLAQNLGLVVPNLNMQGQNPQNMPLPNDVVNDDPDMVKALTLASDLYVQSQQFYEFVRGYADEFLGRKYVVGLPFVMQQQDPETLIITRSYEVTDGGYLPEGSEPLGLSELNEDLLKIQDGRFRAFVYVGSVDGIDFSMLNPQGIIVEDDALYIACDVDQNIIVGDIPMALITLPGPILEEAVDATGNIALVADVLQMSNEQAKTLLTKVSQMGNTPVAISPAPRAPDAAAIPLKSNIYTYGPWFAVGAPGKVKFEQDPGLTPWGFGGYDILDEAGQATVSQAITNMIVAESAVLEYAGPPGISLLEALVEDGPELTDINVSIGDQGATSTYTFRTYTLRFGVFSKGYVERLRRIGTAQQNLRKTMRALIRQGLDRAEAQGAAAKTARAFMENAPKVAKNKSPHDMLVCRSITDGNNTRLGVSSVTYPEAIGLTNANSLEDEEDTSYSETSAMNMAGLFRPFCTCPTSGNNMPSYITPNAKGDVPCVTTLDPWKGFNDIEVFLYGGDFSGMHAFRRQVVGDNARVLGLRGPAVMSGWGYTVDGQHIPSDDAGNIGAQWYENTLTRSDLWAAGPMDALWHQNRGCWTWHTKMRGILQGQLAPGGNAMAEIQAVGGGKKWQYKVYDWMSPSSLPSGTKVFISYVADDNRLYVDGATCPSGS